MRTGRELWPAIAITAAAAIVFLLTHPLDVFWTTDGGNRFIQVQQLARNGELPIEYPGADIDPRFALAPTGGHHFLIREGRLHSFYPPAFPLIVAPLYRLLGLPGLYVIPVLSTLAALLLFGAVARELGAGRWTGVAAVALVFATPLFFYTVSFWEHTLAIAVTLGGVLLVLRRRPALGGAVVALGAAFREEGYVALAAIAMALLSDRRLRETIVFAAGAGAVLAPLWITNSMHYGHPLGLHGAVYDAIAGGGLAERLSNFWTYLFAFTRLPAVQIAVAVPALLLLAIAPLRATPAVQRARTVLLYAAGAASAAAAVALIAGDEPLREPFTTQSLFGAIPFAVTFFAAARELPRFLTALIAAAIVITTAALHQGDIGLIWGPRHFLWLVPLLAVAAMAAMDLLPRGARVAAGLLVAASLAMHIHGVRLLSMKLNLSGEAVRALRESDADVIVTDVFWVPEEMAALWFDRKFLSVANDRELAAVMERLKALGIRRMDFVAARGFHAISPAGYAPLLAHTTGRRRVGGARPMPTDLQVLYVDLGARPSSRSRTASPRRTDPLPASPP